MLALRLSILKLASNLYMLRRDFKGFPRVEIQFDVNFEMNSSNIVINSIFYYYKFKFQYVKQCQNVIPVSSSIQ